MKVLLASRAFPPAIGGIERFAETLAGWLAERGHEVTVATRTPNGDDRQPRPYRLLRAPSERALLGAMRRSQVVHVNGLSVRGVLPALVTRRPTVVTHAGHQAVCPTGLCLPVRGECRAGPSVGPCAGCPSAGAVGVVDVRGHRTVTRSVAANVVISDYLCRRLGLPRSHTILNPVAGEAFARASDDPGQSDLVAFAGRLVAEKGLDLLLRAVASLADVRLEIVGDGPMRAAYRDLADHLGISLRVSFLGPQPFEGVADLYARAAVVCVPSLWEEPFGFVAAEAMAMRRPLAVAPSGALPELCGDDRGFVAAERTAEGVAAAITSALKDRGERERRADRAHRFALEHLSADHVGAAYEAVYREVSR